MKIVKASGGGAVDVLTLSASYSGGFFTLASDGAGGADVDFTPAPFGDVGTPGNVVVGNVSGQAYSAYQDVFASGRFAGIDEYFTDVTGPYSAYEYDYSNGGSLLGSKFYDLGVPAGADYDEYEYDYDGAGALTRAAFSGDTGDPYSAYEYDYVGGVFSGSKYTPSRACRPARPIPPTRSTPIRRTRSRARGSFCRGRGPGLHRRGGGLRRQRKTDPRSADRHRQPGLFVARARLFRRDLRGLQGLLRHHRTELHNEEVDVSASGALEKVVYSGMTGTPYSSVEQDYSGGTLADTVYGYTGVAGQTYNAYQVTEDANGKALQETFDLDSGGHTQMALAAGQTLTSLGDDKMTGSARVDPFRAERRLWRRHDHRT